MKFSICLVAEPNVVFLNETRLALYTLRKNGGLLSDAPVTLIVNGTELKKKDEAFLLANFGPLDIKVFPRQTPVWASKFNAFYANDPDDYDVFLFLDCDLLFLGPLDDIVEPLQQRGKQFLGLRIGPAGFNGMLQGPDGLVNEFCQANRRGVQFEGKTEWPFYNSGVLVATSDAIRLIRSKSVSIAHQLAREFHEVSGYESRVPLEGAKTERRISEEWQIEQIALALAVIDSGVEVEYLDGTYNAHTRQPDGELPQVFHCFKQRFFFDRARLFDDDLLDELSEHEDELMRLMVKAARDFKREFHFSPK